MTTLATVIGKGAIGSRPAAASAGRLYFSTEPKTYRDNGSSWDDVSDAGTGFANPMTTAGDIIYGGASGVATRLAGGTSTYVLTSNGATSAPSWQAPGGGGGGALVLLEQHTASSSATLDFTTFISSTYDQYLVEILNIIPATNSVNFFMRMGTGGGPTFDSGTNYGWSALTWRAGGSGVNGAESGATFIQLAFNGTVSNASTHGVVGSLRLFSPQSTALHKLVLGQTYILEASPFQIGNDIIGSYQSTTAMTAIQFLFSSGNIASGTIRVYGIAK